MRLNAAIPSYVNIYSGKVPGIQSRVKATDFLISAFGLLKSPAADLASLGSDAHRNKCISSLVYCCMNTPSRTHMNASVQEASEILLQMLDSVFQNAMRL